jgi:hypothetical protein
MRRRRSPRFFPVSITRRRWGGIRQSGAEDVKSVTRRGVDLSASLQIFAAASHTEHGRAESEHLRDNCRADPSAGSGDNCPSIFKRP